MINKIEWLIKKSKQEKEVTMTRTHENLFDILNKEYILINESNILHDHNIISLLVDVGNVLKLPTIISEEGLKKRRFNLTIMQSNVTLVIIELIDKLYDYINSKDVLRKNMSEELNDRIELCFEKYEKALKGAEVMYKKTMQINPNVELPQFINRFE